MSALAKVHWRLLVALLGAALCFARTAGFPYSIVDDRQHVENNVLVAAPLSRGPLELLVTPAMGYPHTVTVLSLALDRRALGPGPESHHLGNIVVHLAVIALVYLLLLRLKLGVAPAGMAVMLIALHPLVVEPVSWVIGRKDLLATGFLVAAMAVALGGSEERPSWGRTLASLALTACAMFSKTSTLLAPVLWWPLLACARPKWSWRARLAFVIPSAALAGTVAFISAFGLKQQGAFVTRTPAQLMVDPLRAATLQLQHLAWPRGLVAEYYRVDGDPPWWAIALTLGLTLALAVWAWRTSPAGGVVQMGLVLFAVTFIPAAGLIPTSHWSADSYFYLPMVWVTVLVAALVTPRLPALAWGALSATLWWLSVQQTQTWRSAVDTFEPIVARYPNEPRPLNRLAFSLAEAGRADDAAARFIELEERFPDFPWNQGHRAQAFEQKGDLARARAIFSRCVAQRDEECAGRFWLDVMRGKRSLDTAPRELVDGTGALAAPMLLTRFSPNELGALAGELRRRGYDELAARLAPQRTP